MDDSNFGEPVIKRVKLVTRDVTCEQTRQWVAEQEAAMSAHREVSFFKGAIGAAILSPPPQLSDEERTKALEFVERLMNGYPAQKVSVPHVNYLPNHPDPAYLRIRAPEAFEDTVAHLKADKAEKIWVDLIDSISVRDCISTLLNQPRRPDDQ